MNRLKIFFLLFISHSLIASLLFAQSFTLQIANGKNYGCILQRPANLLVSLTNKSQGKILPFDNEIKKLSANNRKIKKIISSLKNRSDRSSKSRVKKLKRDLKNKTIIIKEIVACRDGIIVQPSSIDCSLPTSNGSACDDGNPCTIGDTCRNSKCSGSETPPTGVAINCGFENCSKTVIQCSDGLFTACFSGVAGNEICNKLDDDCNGTIDEIDLCLTTPTTTPTEPAVPTFTVTAIATSTATALPTATRTPTPVPSPFTCVAPKIPGSNNNPDGCPCNTNGDCIGDCQCGNPCNNTTNTCTSGTCITDINQSNFGSCSGICPSSFFNVCVGAGGNTPICVTGNNSNLSAAGCPCTTNGNCAGNCKCGNPCNNITNPCSAGTTCLPDGSCSGVCKASPGNVCT